MGRGSNGIGIGSHLYRMFNSDFPQGNTEQPGYVPPSDCIPVQDASDLKRPTSGLRVCPDQYYRSIGHQVRRCGMRLGPMAQRAQELSPVHGDEVMGHTTGQGPKAQRARGPSTVHQPPDDSCSAPENESWMTKSWILFGKPNNQSLNGQDVINALLIGALCQIVTYNHHYFLSVHEPRQRVWQLLKESEKFFPPPTFIKCSQPPLDPINNFF